MKRKGGKPFQPGQSGNLAGRPRTERPNALAHALQRELTPAVATKLAKKLIELALEGNLRAFQELLDRSMGRPVQPVAESSHREIVVRIERVGEAARQVREGIGEG